MRLARGANPIFRAIWFDAKSCGGPMVVVVSKVYVKQFWKKARTVSRRRPGFLSSSLGRRAGD